MEFDRRNVGCDRLSKIILWFRKGAMKNGGALHVRKGTIRKDSHSTILIRVERLVSLIRWILGAIPCLTGHVSVNHECIS